MSERQLKHHPILGELQQWDDVTCCDVDFEGSNVGITILCAAEAAEPFVAIAVELASRLPELVKAAKKCAVEQLLDEVWLKDGEDSATPEKFQARMILNSIGIDEDHSRFFSFEDGDLFWGHYITVDLNSDGQFTHAYIDG